jgi:uncharacterized phage protein gp47/JayE
MALYVSKTKTEILRTAIQKVENTTTLTSVGPGSILRAIMESITTEIGDMFNIMDFNIAQSTLSAAQGRALDVIGNLYAVPRRTLSAASQTESLTGSFLFFVSSPVATDIVIPKGTSIYTNKADYIGEQFTYQTTSDVTILTGQTYTYASIKPSFNDSIYTAGANTLTGHNFVSPQGYNIQCNNPKPIAPTLGYEQDEDYRSRIIKNIRVTSAGTGEAIRFKALSYEGVREARIESAVYGMGTFKLFVVPEISVSGPALVEAMRSGINSVAPIGSTMFVELPETVPFTVNANITMSNDISTAAKAAIRGRVRIIIERYINSLLPGSTVVYNRMVSLIYGASAAILDVQITSFSANGTEVSRNNYTPRRNQQLVPSAISVTNSI